MSNRLNLVHDKFETCGIPKTKRKTKPRQSQNKDKDPKVFLNNQKKALCSSFISSSLRKLKDLILCFCSCLSYCFSQLCQLFFWHQTNVSLRSSCFIYLNMNSFEILITPLTKLSTFSYEKSYFFSILAFFTRYFLRQPKRLHLYRM